MSSSAERWACDTSVAVAALDPSHAAHGPCRHALVTRRPALAGHAMFETYAVLTRLPVPLRLTGAQAEAVLRGAFPDDCWLAGHEAKALLSRMPDGRVVGGSVYDALAGEAARVNDCVLLTRDRRAERTYRALGVRFDVVE